MNLTWTYSDDSLMGTRAVALGFDAGDSGVTVAVDGYLQVELDLLPTGYSETQACPVPEAFESCAIAVRYTSSDGAAINPDNIAFTYDGVALEILSTHVLQTTELDVVEVVAWLFIGDPTALATDTLEVSITGVSNPNIVAGQLEVYFVDGIAETAPTLYEAGTLDVFASPLVLDVSPAEEHAAILSFASQAGFTPEDSTLAMTTDDVDVTFTAQTQVSDSSFTLRSYQYAVPAADTSFNCACEVDEDAETLQSMRVKLLSMTGYAAQAQNPPPGIATLYNHYLDTSQKFIYQKFKALQTERFFSWVLEPGVRFYGLWDNGDECAVKLNRYKITGAWIQDLNNVWWPLVEGIDPTFYTLDANFGWPNYYEVRQCIEVFPAPQAAYTLWIKGRFNLLPFTDDADTTTINPAPVQNYATYLAKAAKGAKDAGVYEAMAMEQVSDLIAGGHVSRRYIPASASIPVPTPPVMVHFES